MAFVTPSPKKPNTSDEDELGEEGMDDMINILDLNEQTILRNIERRYGRRQIYTYTGSILVAVNPYSRFNIYGLDMVKKYEGELLGAQPPHLFAIGSAAYSAMVTTRDNQVIVISGESGAGKTESTKLIMQYLAAVNKHTDNLITEQILEASPLLESFGNAKTIRNDNSSRFGKYVKIYFKAQEIVGAKTSEYLLEKSRIVAQMSEERNYHVFYEMLAGLDGQTKDDMGLQTADKYFYLNQGGSSCEIEQKDDRKDFDSLKASMEVLGFSAVEKSTIWSILASVLHLGNVYFTRKQNEHQSEGVELASMAELKWVSHLLKLSEDWLKQGITMKVTEARKERLFTPLNIDQALDARDAISKALYQCLFSWLVQRINDIVSYPNQEQTSIALLDIFGFEDFKVNSFEQLCINYANETLQFYFNKHVFQLEQHEYIREQINWKEIVFSDNQPTIDLIAKKPMGVIHILDDESNFPKATDQSFLEKCHYEHTTNAFYGKPRLSAPEFSIKHYAGFVTYNVRNFLDKNKDTLRNDVVDLMIQSQNTIISKMFQDYRDEMINKSMAKMPGHYVTMKKPRTPTVAANFHQSLLNLIDTMSKCSPWFVRCLKPNNEKLAMEFDREVVLSQLRYTGMLETIRIRKMGFPVRLRFRQFCQNYYVLHKRGKNQSKGSFGEDKETCKEILSKALTVSWKSSWQIGISKIFMKESLSYHLEDLKQTVTERAVVVLQQMARGILARKRYLRSKKATIALQAAFRAYLARKRFVGVVRGVMLAQAQVRMQMQRRRYRQHLNEIRARERELEQKRQASNKHRANKQPSQRWPQPPNQTFQQTTLSLDRNKMSRQQVQRSAQLDSYTSQLQRWSCCHTDYHLESAQRIITPLPLDTTLPEQIDSFVFSKYANIYFKHPFKRLDAPIQQPFLSKQNQADVKPALQLFQMILSFMADGELSDKNERLQANYIVQQVLENQALADEFYCQLVTQTWENPDRVSLTRGWKLMSAGLSAFPPSPTLSNYLLKYVSDHGHQSYKSVCQYKLLQCMQYTPDRARNYPPTLMEWSAAQKHQGMALQAILSDKQTATAAVQSWTTGDEFTAHLLQSRNIDSGCFGWTVLLQDNHVQYELSGDDYVLDLLSEMEYPPGQSYCARPFVVTHDPTEQGSHSKRAQDTPHDPDVDKVALWRISEIEQPVPVDPRPAPTLAPPTQQSPHLLSTTSVLNKRQATNDPSLAQDSILNVRYINHSRPTAVTPRSGASNGDFGGSSGGYPEYREDFELSNNRLNKRYNAGDAQNTPGTRNAEQPSTSGGAPPGRYNAAWDRGSMKSSSDPSNLEEWVDTMFNDALGTGFDDMSDARTLSNRLKGGGKGLPGIAQNAGAGGGGGGGMYGGGGAGGLGAGLPNGFGGFSAANGGLPVAAGSLSAGLPGAVPPVKYGPAMMGAMPPMVQPTFSGPTTGAIPLGGFPTMMDPVMMQQVAQQQAAQQLAAQQLAAQQQAAAQVARQYQLDHQRHMVAQEQNFKLQTEVQKQVLQNQLAEQTIQSEMLNKKMHDLGIRGAPPAGGGQVAANVTFTSGAPGSPNLVRRGKPTSPPVARKPIMNGHVPGARVPGEIDNSRPGGAVPQRSATGAPPPPGTADSSAVPPPPPPPMPETSSNDNHSKPPVVGASLQPQQPEVRSGVRVGKIQWPPIKQEETREEVKVGKLLIDEKKHKDKPKIEGTPLKMNLIKDSSPAPKKPVPGKLAMATAPPPPPVFEPGKIPPPPPLPTAVDVDAKHGDDVTDTVAIDMASRKTLLAQKLTEVGMLKASKDGVSPAESYDDVRPEPEVDTRGLEGITTVQHQHPTTPYLAYHNVPWSLHVRKELFTPTETIDNQSVIDLLFCQIVNDVFSTSCIRINKQDKMRMQSTMQNNGITPHSMLNNHKPKVKRMIIDTAREWPYYFSRLFHVKGGARNTNLNMVAVGHSGVRLLSLKKDLFADSIDVLEHFRFEDIIDYSVPNPDTFQLHVGSRYIIMYTPKAYQLKDLIEAFCIECEKDVTYGRALRSYRTREQTLLSFAEGDIIKIARNAETTPGWLYGSLKGKAGLFPAEYIKPLAVHEIPEKPQMPRRSAHPVSPAPQPTVHNFNTEDMDGQSTPSVYDTLPPPGGKYSMLEFAMLHFRKSPYRYVMSRHPETGSIHGSIKMISSLKAKAIQLQQQKKHQQAGNWNWSEEVDMIKWTKSPIQASLLKLNEPLNKIALECFFAVMQYMGDYPLYKGQRMADCVYTILTACHNHFQIVDEVYCQLVKQTTSNKSVKPESLQQGWRLMAIMTAFYNCTDVLRPYLLKYLEQTAYDNQRQHQAIAALSLNNLRTTIRFGGRKNVPSRIEVEAMTRGRNSKRQTCILPGGIPTVLNVRSSSVVLDSLAQICQRLEINEELEREEMTIFYVIQSENRYCPLKRGEYVFDITTELINQKKSFYLLFQRTSWVMPLVFSRNPLYIDVMFHQCIPDYLDGFLLPLPGPNLPVYIKEEIAILAALQYKASEQSTATTSKDMLALVPRNVLSHSDASQSSWLQYISDALKSLTHRSPHQCKVQFLEVLSKWPLFGSTFFTIKSVADSRIKGECLLAINKHGVHFLHSRTHETQLRYKFDEIISTRRLQADNRAHYLEMKCGDLMKQKITRLETDQGSDISRLIAQYIMILSKLQRPR